MRITSSQNPVIKYVRSLEKARMRREEGVYLAEGVRLVDEAIQTGQEAALVLYDPDLLNRSAAGSLLLGRLTAWPERLYQVDERVLGAAAQTEHPAGVLAVLRHVPPPRLEDRALDRFGVILDRLADPGNAGTILRTAAAAGVNYVVSTPGTIDLFAPKVVRAGMGAHFRLPVYVDHSWPEIRQALPDVSLVSTVAGGGTSIYRFSWPERTGLVIGSEAHGLSPEAEGLMTSRIHIPMKPGVESLNASVAAAIAMYAALGPRL